MASVNKVILVGNLGRDPETRYTTDQSAITNFSIATTDKWKDKSGEQQEKTEWHRISTFQRLAEIAGEYLKKGSQVYIEGRLQTRKWTDKDGVEKYTTEIIADKLQMLGSRQSSGDDGRTGSDDGQQYSRASGSRGSSAPRHESKASAPSKPAGSSNKGSPNSFDDFEDDIPF